MQSRPADDQRVQGSSPCAPPCKFCLIHTKLARQALITRLTIHTIFSGQRLQLFAAARSRERGADGRIIGLNKDSMLRTQNVGSISHDRICGKRCLVGVGGESSRREIAWPHRPRGDGYPRNQKRDGSTSNLIITPHPNGPSVLRSPESILRMAFYFSYRDSSAAADCLSLDSMRRLNPSGYCRVVP